MAVTEEKTKVVQPFELLLDQGTLATRIAELGDEISRDYAGKAILLIGVLKGCFVFMADLIRHIGLSVEIEFLTASQFRKSSAPTELSFQGGPGVKVTGRHVLVVEGVVDTGHTVQMILKSLKEQEPVSLEVVTLLDKPGSHRSKMEIKYRGFSVGNEFVIGFGLDNTQRYRNLPFVGRMSES